MSEFLNLLKENFGEDISKIETIISEKNKKIDTIIQEAFKDDFANKSTAVYKIKYEFVDDMLAPKIIDIAFLKENMDYIVNKVNSLDEGEIKIIINNDVNKAGRTPIASISDEDEEMEMEGTKIKAKKAKKMKKAKKVEKTDKKEEKEIVEEKEDANADNTINITVEDTIVKVDAGVDTGLEGTEQEFESNELAQQYADSLRKFFDNQKDIVVTVTGVDEPAKEETPEEIEEPIDDTEEETPEEDDTQVKPEVEECDKGKMKKTEIKEEEDEDHESSETPEEEKAEHKNGEEESDEVDISWDDVDDFTDEKDSDEDIENDSDDDEDENKKKSDGDGETGETDETSEEDEEIKAESVSIAKKYVGRLIKTSDAWYMVESISQEGLVCKDKTGESKVVNPTDIQIVEEKEDEEDVDADVSIEVTATDETPSDDIVDDEEKKDDETEDENSEEDEEDEVEEECDKPVDKSDLDKYLQDM